MYIDVNADSNTFYIEAQEPNKSIVEIASSSNSNVNIDVDSNESYVNIDVNPNENNLTVDVNFNNNNVNVDVIDKDIVINSGGISSESNDLSSSVTWANVPDVNITQSSVTQHESALSITESQISDLSSNTDTQLTEEQVQDFVGAMLTGNTETGITVTYQDTNGTVDFAVASQTDENFTTTDHAKLDSIETSADVTDTDNVTSAGALMDSEVTNLSQVKTFDSSDYATTAQGTKADSAQQPPSEGAFANGDKTKLDGIEASATANDTDTNLKNRSNHTGTQVASTISDFDTAVTDNVAVVANTAKVSNATHTGDVTGSDTLTIANNAITPDKIGAGGFVFNEAGDNVDFAIHGDSLENVFYVDASTDRVGLGTDTPLTKLHIHATDSEGTILSQTDLDTSFAGFLVRNQDNVNVFSAQYCNSNVAATSLRNTVLIGSRESGVAVKFYQGKETTNLIGANGAFETNNERIIFDVDGNTILTAASGKNVQVSGVELDVDGDVKGVSFIKDGGSSNEFLKADGSIDTNIYLTASNSVNSLSDVALNTPINNNQVLSYSGGSFTNTDLALSLMKRGSIPFGGYSSDQMGHYFFFDGSSEAVINTDGDNIDFRVEGDGDQNLLFCDASTDKVGIGTTDPTQKLDIDSDGIRIRDDKTPSSANDIGNKGDIAWDSNYMYVCVATDTWKRSALSTW